jgi:hypothetical protein
MAKKETKPKTQSKFKIMATASLIQCKHYIPSWATIATEKNGNISQNPPGDDR